MAGMNIRVQVWRMSNDSDDSVGGSMITGSVVYSGIQAFMQENQVSMMMGQAGLETLNVFNFTLIPGTLTIYERDELEITHPSDHYFYGDRFRVVSSRHSSNNPRVPRNYLLLSTTRSVRMHRQQ